MLTADLPTFTEGFDGRTRCCRARDVAFVRNPVEFRFNV